MQLSHKQQARKLLLCLPICKLDAELANELTKLWCDIEPAKNSRVDVLIAIRKDMSLGDIPEGMVERLKAKFSNVYVHKSPFEGDGWPHGCNALELGALHIFVENTRDRKWDHPYMLIAEPDTVPMRPTWLHEITEEAYDHDVSVLGSYFMDSDGLKHINGNAVFKYDFWRKMPEVWSCPPNHAWDFYIRNKAIKHGAPSELIWQEYKLGTTINPWKSDEDFFADKFYKGSDNPLFGVAIKPAMFHGCKTMQAIDAVRKRYSLKPRA